MALSRLTADHDLERHLDGVQLAPGFSYAEEAVGTNGIDTALVSGQEAHVFGHEHYAEHLEDLACAAVPIRHPISGKAIGAVNLTCWRKDAGRLLIALAHSTAGQITQELLNDSSTEEFQLLREYLRTCRHTGGFVVALANDMVVMNDRRGTRSTRRPGRAPRPCSRGAGRRPPWPRGCRAAHRGQGADALPAPAREGRPAARRRCRACEAARAGQPARLRWVWGQARRRAGSGPPWPAPALWLRGCRQVEAA